MAYLFIGDYINYSDEEIIQEIKNNKIDKINIGADNKRVDFSFLSGLENIVQVDIDSRIFINTDFLNTLPNLKKIAGYPCQLNSLIDSQSLERMYCKYGPKFKLSNRCVNLKEFSIRNCSKTESLYNELNKLKQLDFFGLFRGNHKDLKNIPGHLQIKKMWLDILTKLESYEGIEQFSDSLEELRITSTKKVTDYSALGKLKKLKKLIISTSSPLYDLSFLEGMTSLEELRVIETKIRASDTSFLGRIPDLVFLNTGIDKLEHHSK